ncbi:MAG: hypothetical protein HY344_03925 [Candidatus Levybacteria bacterium]|nr:hypothetical protein [Candidatus Levybacteria bacterium]
MLSSIEALEGQMLRPYKRRAYMSERHVTLDPADEAVLRAKLVKSILDGKDLLKRPGRREIAMIDPNISSDLLPSNLAPSEVVVWERQLGSQFSRVYLPYQAETIRERLEMGLDIAQVIVNVDQRNIRPVALLSGK